MRDNQLYVTINQITGEDQGAYETHIKRLIQDIYAFRKVYNPSGKEGIVATHDIAIYGFDRDHAKIKSADKMSVEVAFMMKKTKEVSEIIAYRDHRLWAVQAEKLVALDASPESIPAALMISSALQAAVMARTS